MYVLTGEDDGDEGGGDDCNDESSYNQGGGHQAQGEASRGLLAYRNADECPVALHDSRRWDACSCWTLTDNEAYIGWLRGTSQMNT